MYDFNGSGELEGKDSLVDALYRRHAPAIFAFLRQHTTSREDAEDLLLEVFISALENAKFGELPEGQQLAWLWRVARNKTIDSYRRSTRHPLLALEHIETELYYDEQFSPEQSALRRDEYHRLYAVLKELTPLQRDVLRLRFANNLRCTEIAQAMGKKESAIRVLLMRTMRFLRTIYSSEPREGRRIF